MLIHFERVGCAEHDHAGKHVPLDFKPAVGAFTENIAARGVTGTDKAASKTSQFATTAN